MPRFDEYEVVIIGGGPAGLAAGLYAARALRRTLLIERNFVGGQIALTARVENYPGFADGIGGADLAQAMHRQAEQSGMETAYLGVSGIERREDGKLTLHTDAGDLVARAVVVTAGADPNRLNVPGEERLTGRGVSYCATCDAAFFPEVEVAVVGGGDAACDEGLFVTRYASKVYLVHRRDTLRASQVLQERVLAEPKIQPVWNTVVEEIEGEQEVEALRLRNVVTGERSRLPAKAAFIFIGQWPNSDFIGDLADRDAGRHIIVDLWMQTKTPGVFAAGDVRAQSARQVVSAAGDGATAAIRADHYLNDHFSERLGAAVPAAERTA